MTATKNARSAGRTKKRSSPSEIAPGVYVGGWKDAVAFAGTRFCVLDEARPDMPSSTHVPIYSEATKAANRANLDRLADAVRKARADGTPVLIYCGMGVRRAALGGAWYLHRTEKLSLDAAYERVRSARPQIEHASEWIADRTGLD